MNSKLHVVCDGQGRPRTMFLTAGHTSDYSGAAAVLSSLPAAKVLLADRGYDADWFRDALADRGIEAVFGGFDPPDQIFFPQTPSKSNRKTLISHDKARYRNRHKIENMFCKLKDWWRIHTRYDRCAEVFMSAIAIADTVLFWL